MFTSRIVALATAVGLALPLVPGTAAASPYLVKLHSDAEVPAGYAPAGTHEVIVEAVPVPEAPPTPPEPAPVAEAVIVTAPVAPAPVVEPYADPSLRGPTTTTVIVAAPPAPPAAPRRPPPPPKRGLGLMIAGFSMFGTSYLLTAWAGAMSHDGHGGCNRTKYECREMGKALMVPFIGPMIAAQDTDSARETLGLFMLSGIQIATFVMGVVGAVRYSRYKRWERGMAGLPLGKSGLAVAPMPRFDGGGLGLNYRF
ncbi:hypothetical protein [Nannocystis pusilla]|uniref:Uncharacterized protein n=1 Tax=Nannocystis pusilla TaxID=889268 RepID=A0ABS7U270_9BACT|nr:hypothetical protein [Nannocystis pusilla]MBZ5714445.1 hypothetical protein [Nannocystis pusilla]